MARDIRHAVGVGSGGNLDALDSERVNAATQDLDLAEDELALLKDPAWMDENEADAIMAMRIEKEEADSATPIREYMRERAARSRIGK
jgi:hypothetical protein